MAGTILIVEDDETTMRLLQDIFFANDFRVITAIDGQEAVQKAIEEKPDLITMDMQLPGMNGFETTRVIKNSKGLCHVPIVAITANAMTGHDRDALQAGCVAYISKPFDIDTLINTVIQFMPTS